MVAHAHNIPRSVAHALNDFGIGFLVLFCWNPAMFNVKFGRAVVADDTGARIGIALATFVFVKRKNHAPPSLRLELLIKCKLFMFCRMVCYVDLK